MNELVGAALGGAVAGAVMTLLAGRAVRAALDGARLRAIDDGGFVLDLRVRKDK